MTDGIERLKNEYDWYRRECKSDDCDVIMEDLSNRVYCNNCLDDKL